MTLTNPRLGVLTLTLKANLYRQTHRPTCDVTKTMVVPRYVPRLWCLGCYDTLHAVGCGWGGWIVQVTDGQWLTGRQSLLAVRCKNCCTAVDLYNYKSTAAHFYPRTEYVHKTLTTWAQFQNILLPYETVYIHTVLWLLIGILGSAAVARRKPLYYHLNRTFMRWPGRAGC